MNKTELYNYLSDYILLQHTPRKMLYCTKGIDIIATSDSKIYTDIDPYIHKEADTRIILHAIHCAKHGHRRILIRSLDTDVVVVSIAAFGFKLFYFICTIQNNKTVIQKIIGT